MVKEGRCRWHIEEALYNCNNSDASSIVLVNFLSAFEGCTDV